MILDMEGILLGGGRADKGINKNQKNIDLETHIVTYIPALNDFFFEKEVIAGGGNDKFLGSKWVKMII